MMIQPYLFFEGRCEAAVEFYRQALGAELLTLMRYRENPDPPPPDRLPPGSEDNIMHAALRIGETTLMMSDGFCSGQPGFQGFSLSLGVASQAEARQLFDALADQGQVQMPLGQTFWSPCFGMVTDRFGVGWMVGMEAETQ